MRAKLTQDFECYPEGHTKRSYEKGAIVSGNVAEMAIASNAGVEVKDGGKSSETKDKGAAPENKAKK